MQTAKLFMSGRSQAVRLPKAFAFPNENEVIIQKYGQGILLMPKKNPGQVMQEAVYEFDTSIERAEQGEQIRADIL
ncbi:antitoxin [Lonepinella sp. BR2930]|uniref:antitoxin n=1 Tax=Lonepinella sp. BR2930 TaxID=3434554 RepID=UPI003F6E3FB9